MPWGAGLMRYDRMRPHQVQAAIAAGTPVVLPLG